MCESKHAAFLHTKSIKVEIISSNFDGDILSRLSNYVIEVVDGLIDTTRCWFTVLNAGVLTSEVCSLAVRKISVDSPSRHLSERPQERFLLLCFCLACGRGLNSFEAELNEFCAHLECVYLEADKQGIQDEIGGWYSACVSYITEFLTHYGQLAENFIYWLCLQSEFVVLQSEPELTRSINTFVRFLRMPAALGVDSSGAGVEVEALQQCGWCSSAPSVVIKSDLPMDPHKTSGLIHQVVAFLVPDHLGDPITLKECLQCCVRKIQEEYVSAAAIMVRGQRDYNDFFGAYRLLKASPNCGLLLDMLEAFAESQSDMVDCVAVIRGHLAERTAP